MVHLWKLLGRLPVPVADVLEWGRWFATADRTVARDEIDGFVISTVFLGVGHADGMVEPQLFETMVFRGISSTWCERCSTWDQALEQHRTVLDRVKGELGIA